MVSIVHLCWSRIRPPAINWDCLLFKSAGFVWCRSTGLRQLQKKKSWGVNEQRVIALQFFFFFLFSPSSRCCGDEDGRKKTRKGDCSWPSGRGEERRRGVGASLFLKCLWNTQISERKFYFLWNPYPLKTNVRAIRCLGLSTVMPLAWSSQRAENNVRDQRWTHCVTNKAKLDTCHSDPV